MIGFVRLGNMGTPIVRNLAAAGHHVRVWNRTADKAESLARELEGKVTAAASAREAAQCGLVFSIVANDKVRERTAGAACPLVCVIRDRVGLM